MDELKSGGVESRLKLAGSLVSADKIKQKRRRYLKMMPTPTNAAEPLSGISSLNEHYRKDTWSSYRQEEEVSHIPRNAASALSMSPRPPNAMNIISITSGVSTVRCSGQLSSDEGSVQRPVHATLSGVTLPLCWPGDNAAGAGNPWDIENMEVTFNTDQENLSNAHWRFGSPCLPDHMFDDMMNEMGTVWDFPLSPSSQTLLMPLEGALETPYVRRGGSLTLSRAEDNLSAFSSKKHEASPFYQLEEHIRNLRITSAGRSEQSDLIFEPCHNNIFLPNELTDRHRGQSNTSVFREIASIARNAQMIAAIWGQERLIQDHRLEKLADILGSLLPDNMPELSDYTSGFDDSSFAGSKLLESTFQRTILYSAINSFAGLPRLPAFPLLQTHLSCFRLIKSCPSLAVRSFIDNAFSAAVWSTNARAVDFLLKMTYGTPYPVDVNKIIVSKGEVPSTPIRVALRYAKHRRPDRSGYLCDGLETAEVLLKAGVDPTDALEFLAGGPFHPDSASVEFIRKLLDRGAEPGKKSLDFALRRGDEAFIDFMLARIPRTSYQMFFSKKSVERPAIARTALYASNSTATRIIKHVLRDWPRSKIEKHFPHMYESTMECTLVHACAKGNKELVESLLPLVSHVSSAALAAAIRSCQQPLIELLLESGANTSDAPMYVFNHHHPGYTCMDPAREIVIKRLVGELLTPLAEAIRSRNISLVEKLECTLTRSHHRGISQALEAAVDVGDLYLFQKILHRTSSMFGVSVRKALCLAIDRNHDDIAFMLLDAGMDINLNYGHSLNSMDFPLLSAIKARKEKLIEAILEHDIDLSDPCYIRMAVLLGDVDTVKVLLFSQATVSLRALKTALKTGDENMLNTLLDHFWRHDSQFQDQNSAYHSQDYYSSDDEEFAEIVKSAVRAKNDTLLVSFLDHGKRVGRRAIQAAMRGDNSVVTERLLAHAMQPNLTLNVVIKLQNHTLLRQWLSNRRCPLNEKAFLHAMLFDKKAFAILMEVFKARYPKGLKGWGGILLKNAIRNGDSSQLKELLDLRMDVNSFGRFQITRETHKLTRNKPTSTPLGFAIYSKKGKDLGNMQMLLDAGSEPNGIASNAEADRSERNGIASNTNANSLGRKTPLILAVETGDLDLIQFLLERRADVNLDARHGRKRTPLQRACEMGNLQVVELLLNWQAHVNGKPAVRAGGTALQLTAIGGSIKIAKLLLQNGADVRAPPAKIHGRTPFEGAAEHGRLDMLKVIWDARFPEGISEGEARRAIHFSQRNGHRACEQYISGAIWALNILRTR
ncbi:hypothetical protein G7054_g8077 [Neopestalotiopsis clavispora]|nr:hypothetical protein G7054_g8077 [Neopestalotiopsis clavispora]